MRKGKINMLLDAQWGSSGKGKMAPMLAERHGVTHASTSNGPNAGHTYRHGTTKVVFKCLPSACVQPGVEGVLLTGASIFDQDTLNTELGATSAHTFIHERATILSQTHRAQEALDERTRSIASTMQGTGAAKCDKVMRKPGVIAREAMRPGMRRAVTTLTPVEAQDLLWSKLASGATWLHEISQGYALSLDHGSSYPHCTSRNCSVGAAVDDLGVPPHLVGDVYVNVRPYPIRVGNFTNEHDGSVIGYSGDVYHDHHETTWEHVGIQAGMPAEVIARLAQDERTTVTKRVRRVFTFSAHGFRQACRANGATHILLNFAQYLDWSIMGQQGSCRITDLPPRVRDFAFMLRTISDKPVVAIGTGPDHTHIIHIEQ